MKQNLQNISHLYENWRTLATNVYRATNDSINIVRQIS